MQLDIRFASRTPGSFGRSRGGRVLEWLTQTWLRFTCLLISLAITAVAAAANIPPAEKLTLIAAAPIMAVVYWYVLLFFVLICRHLGLVGKILAHLLVIYFFLFARLVVQAPPKIELPLISDR